MKPYLFLLGTRVIEKRKKEKKQYCGFVLFAALVFIYSCSSVSVDKRPYAYLTDRSKYILLPPAGIERPVDMAQRISALYNGQRFYFSSWVLADENGIDISFFNELGAAIGDLSYREGVVSLSSTVFPKSLKPEYMIADFQLCFYDPDLLARALKDCGLVLETQNSHRRIFKGKNLIIEIEKTPGAVKLVNHLRGYSYILEGDNN
jgi:hypothetical protein